MAILVSIGYGIRDVINHKNKITSKTIEMDMNFDETVVILNTSNFDMAVYFQYYNGATNPDVLLHLDHYVDLSF
jgi:hypothetical protein